jgi:2',3'-cyclic-nucleotide 2'-phosphodiesterase (5'-nucleotidase family)
MPARWHGRPVEPDARVAEIVGKYDVEVKQLRESRIGSTQIALTKGGSDDLLANLTADALRSGAGGGLSAMFAFQNQGGLRISEIPKGPITFGQIFDLTPFDNQQVVVTLKAHEVRNALEAVLRGGKGALKVSGLRYTVDVSHVQKGKPDTLPPGAIVTDLVQDDGKLLCHTESCTATECRATCAEGDYTVAVTDFLANGGDGLGLLRSAPQQTGTALARDVVIAYVKQHDPLTPELLGSVKAGAKQRITWIGGEDRDYH